MKKKILILSLICLGFMPEAVGNIDVSSPVSFNCPVGTGSSDCVSRAIREGGCDTVGPSSSLMPVMPCPAVDACCGGGGQPAPPAPAPAGAPTPGPLPTPRPGPTQNVPPTEEDCPGMLTITTLMGQNDCDPVATPTPPVCESSVSVGDWGTCDGSWGPWNTATRTRTYSGSECRTNTTTNSCGGGSTDEECRPCGYDETDFDTPVCESVVDWTARPIESIVLNCSDAISGCDESSYENGQINANRTDVEPARACDEAGNCVDCPITNPDDLAPSCTATFLHTGRWHRDESFEVNGGPVRCWLESCEDEGPSGCLPLGTLENTEKTYSDVGGMREAVEVEQDPLETIHRDTCTIQVCDNAGNCSTCESPEIAYDGTDVCRSAIGFCGECAEDDVDCRCIGGERDMCTNSGPVNCYADPFDERCPGFDNPACLSHNFTPGCPPQNPCFPTDLRSDTASCPEEAIRFCARNPYHYGCNQACKLGLIECEPEPPSGANCGVLPTCVSGERIVSDGRDGDGCRINPRCEADTRALFAGREEIEQGLETPESESIIACTRGDIDGCSFYAYDSEKAKCDTNTCRRCEADHNWVDGACEIHTDPATEAQPEEVKPPNIRLSRHLVRLAEESLVSAQQDFDANPNDGTQRQLRNAQIMLERSQANLEADLAELEAMGLTEEDLES